jgi:hypothetical protein
MESSEEISVILQVAVLMGILQNLTHNSYFASYVFVGTLIRGLFFFQPPMGYKKRQIDIT